MANLGTYVWPNPVWLDTHQEEVDYVKQWLLARMNWLNQELDFNLNVLMFCKPKSIYIVFLYICLIDIIKVKQNENTVF